jgi:integrase
MWSLAAQGKVVASTQNGALNALVFLHRQVLKQPFPELEGLERANRPQCIPTAFTAEERQAMLAQLNGTLHLMAGLLDGDGLRPIECVPLRVKDIDFAYQQITVRQAAAGTKHRQSTRGEPTPRLASCRPRHAVTPPQRRGGKRAAGDAMLQCCGITITNKQSERDTSRQPLHQGAKRPSKGAWSGFYLIRRRSI